MSRTRTRATAIVAAAAVAVSLLGVPQPAPAAASSRHEASVSDRLGDVAAAHVDIRAAGISYTTKTLRLTAKLARRVDVQARGWRLRSTYIKWTLDTAPGNGGETAVLIRRRNGRLTATMTPNGWPTVLCRGSVRVIRRTVTVSLARSECLDSHTVRGWVQTSYIAKPNTWDPEIQRDRAPSRGWLPVVHRPRGLSDLEFGFKDRTVVDYGSAHTITGLLGWGRWSLANRPVTLYRRWSSQHPWTRLGTERTDEYGVARWWPQHVADRPAQFVMRFRGDSRNAPSRSRILRILPRMVVHAELHPGEYRAPGSTAYIEGEIRPAAAGGKIALQRRVGNRWRTVSHSAVRKGGQFTATFTVPQEWHHDYRVRHGGTRSILPGVSRSMTVVVHDAEVKTVRPSHPVAEVEDLNNEYFVLRNTTREHIHPGGWQVVSTSGGVAYISGGLMHPGEEVRVHTGRGAPRPGHFYLQRYVPMWSSAGDVVTILDRHGDLIDQYAYGAAAPADAAFR